MRSRTGYNFSLNFLDFSDRLMPNDRMKKLRLILAWLLLSPLALAEPYLIQQAGVLTQGSSVVTTSTVQIAPKNLYRASLMIQNQGGASVIVKYGSAQTGTEGFWIAPGATFTSMNPVITNSVFAESVSGNVTLWIIDAVK